jgi:hypothetical protein
VAPSVETSSVATALVFFILLRFAAWVQKPKFYHLPLAISPAPV